MIKEYYQLAKPGIIYGNGITTIAAFLYAAKWHMPLEAFLALFIPTILGISLVIGSACVFNNYLDRGMDAKMERTKNRALVTGIIPVRNALRFGAAIGILGFALLIAFVNFITAAIAFIGFASYVGIYTLLKRESSWAALVGTIPGAVPIVVGYTAVTNHVDGVSVLLFLILAFWQLPHFYAIAIFRKEEYAAAAIPVLSVAKGTNVTKKYILYGVIAYLVAVLAFFFHEYAGYSYLGIVSVFGVMWLVQSIRGFKTSNDVAWARGLFRFSLIILLSFCVVLALAPVLP